jgi:SRSO17 transposase
LRYSWIGADSNYGGCAFVLNELEDAGERFLMDVRRNVKVWDVAPEFKPQPTAQTTAKALGRPAQRRQLSPGYQGRYLTVEALCAEHFKTQSRAITYRHGPSGPLTAQVWVKEVWAWEPGWPKARRRWLIVAQDRQGQFKYSLSNCMDINDWQRLCYMQHQRYFIEKAFQDAKSQLGMAQYQMRGWIGWHHHMTLVCLAMLFSLKEQILAANTKTAPLLSLRDITELLDHYLPRKARDETGVLERIHRRHQARQLDIDRKNRARSHLTKSN